MSNSATHTLEMEWNIAAPVSDVWAALIYEIGNWWPASMFCSEKAQEMVLEPSLGGRLYEDHGNGQGMVWYTVYTLIENEIVELLGPVMPRWGGPSISTLSLALVEEGETTKLKLTEGTLGAPMNEVELRDGWNKVFGSLQTYVAERSTE